MRIRQVITTIADHEGSRPGAYLFKVKPRWEEIGDLTYADTKYVEMFDEKKAYISGYN